mmetsp:Transcript_118017/g.176319  ORF Transcript_118017/g.176319 Transcript_118017/m.176319 type:complete len:378 (+) Transcript_118017:96-1229(+)
MSAQTLVQMPQAYPHSNAGLGVAADPAVNHNIPFPWKLHELLDVAEADAFTNIVSWLPNQHSFRVHDIQKFVDHIMKRFFKQTKYKSFQRQLNMWGFERILNGPEKGGYSHNYFVRGKPSLCCHMTRLKVKGTGVSGTVTPIKIETFTSAAAPTTVHSSPVRPPLDIISSTPAGSKIAPFSQSSNDQQKASNIENQNNFFDAGILDQVLQCAVLDDSVPSRSDGISAGLIPSEGDSVLFEGRQFFLVGDYHPEPSSSSGGSARPRSAQRRMSIEFAPIGINQPAGGRSRRRLSLLPLVNPPGEASGLTSHSSSAAQFATEGRRLTLEPISVPGASQPSRKQSRRFSLERVASSTPNANNPGAVNFLTAGYVLRQLQC